MFFFVGQISIFYCFSVLYGDLIEVSSLQCSTLSCITKTFSGNDLCEQNTENNGMLRSCSYVAVAKISHATLDRVGDYKFVHAQWPGTCVLARVTTTGLHP